MIKVSLWNIVLTVYFFALYHQIYRQFLYLQYNTDASVGIIFFGYFIFIELKIMSMD